MISWFTTMSQKNVSDNGSDWCSDTTRQEEEESDYASLGGCGGIAICPIMLALEDPVSHFLLHPLVW